MTHVLAPITSIITQPAQTFRRMTLSHSGFAAMIVFSVFLLSVLGHVWCDQTDVYSGNPKLFFVESLYLLLTIIAGILLLTAVIHLSADFLGGGGRGRTLLFFLMLSSLPLWLTGPAACLLKIVFSLSGLYPIVMGLLALWSLYLVVIAIRELYRFTVWRAASALFIPLIFLSGLGGMIILAGHFMINPM
ncbi:YIP1 family protein [bacterium]|nr:YIP1 family protein [candidate division CSSED10-310 bacterium]